MLTLDPSIITEMKTIVVSTDFSPASETALLYALAIAKRNGSRVLITHVVTENYQLISDEAQKRAIDEAWRDAQALVTEQFIAGRLDDVPYQLRIERGDVWDRLSDLITKETVDLLVIGTSGHRRLGKLLLGSTAEKIFRQASCPVLSVGPRARKNVPPGGPRKILFCTGFSHHSLMAGARAIWMAQRLQASLILLNVVADAKRRSAEQRKDLIQSNQRRLRELVPADAGLAAQPEVLVEFGNAGECILETATKHKVDLIVLGVRQSAGFYQRLRGATASRVVTGASCPVLTVRTPATEA
ncbi:MAG TPA: universal stress protein [Terriglobales bacterium]|nr:universal stress protein [Terriglobales bacterium]